MCGKRRWGWAFVGCCDEPAPGRDERGQVIVLLAVLMVVLLGVCGLVIDGGNWMVNRREIQNAADAAALAGASQIPSGSSLPPIETAREQYANNGDPSDTVTVTSTTYLTSGDSVTVTASRKVDTFFTSIFGLDQVTETATARATRRIVHHHQRARRDAMGRAVRIVRTRTAILDLHQKRRQRQQRRAQPALRQRRQLSRAQRRKPYEDEINGTSQPCPITIGDLLDTKDRRQQRPHRQRA